MSMPLFRRAVRKLFRPSLGGLLSFVLIFQSFLPSVAQAQETAVSSDPSPVISNNLELLDYYPPADLARVSDSYFVANSTIPLVLLIQDLHCHPGVQRKISGLLSHYDSLGIAQDSVFVEGASGVVDTTPMALFPDEAIKREVTEEFVDSGLFTGMEEYAILNKKTHYLYGVEEGKTYNLHKDFFRKSLEGRSQLAQKIQSLQGELQELEPSVLNRSQKKLLEKSRDYQSGQLSLAKYLKYLDKQSSDIPAELKSMQSLLDLETQLPKPERLKSDTKDFLTILYPRFTKEEADRLSQYAKANTEVYYLYLFQLANRYNALSGASTALRDYLTYNHRKEHQDLSQFQRKLEGLEHQLLLAESKDQTQKNLVQAQRDLKLLQDLLELKLTEDQLKEILPRTKDLLAVLGTLIGSQEKTEELQELIAQAIDFYALALMRDEPLIEKTLGKQGNNPAILVTGGFHTQGIARMLKAKNIPYLTLSPNVESYSEQDQKQYIDILLGKVPKDLQTPETQQALSPGVGIHLAEALKLAEWRQTHPGFGHKKSAPPDKITKEKVKLFKPDTGSWRLPLLRVAAVVTAMFWVGIAEQPTTSSMDLLAMFFLPGGMLGRFEHSDLSVLSPEIRPGYSLHMRPSAMLLGAISRINGRKDLDVRIRRIQIVQTQQTIPLEKLPDTKTRWFRNWQSGQLLKNAALKTLTLALQAKVVLEKNGGTRPVSSLRFAIEGKDSGIAQAVLEEMLSSGILTFGNDTIDITFKDKNGESTPVFGEETQQVMTRVLEWVDYKLDQSKGSGDGVNPSTFLAAILAWGLPFALAVSLAMVVLSVNFDTIDQPADLMSMGFMLKSERSRIQNVVKDYGNDFYQLSLTDQDQLVGIDLDYNSEHHTLSEKHLFDPEKLHPYSLQSPQSKVLEKWLLDPDHFVDGKPIRFRVSGNRLTLSERGKRWDSSIVLADLEQNVVYIGDIWLDHLFSPGQESVRRLVLDDGALAKLQGKKITRDEVSENRKKRSFINLRQSLIKKLIDELKETYDEKQVDSYHEQMENLGMPSQCEPEWKAWYYAAEAVANPEEAEKSLKKAYALGPISLEALWWSVVMLEDNRPHLRHHVISAIFAMGREGIESLYQELKDGYSERNQAIVEFLGEMKHRASVPELNERLENDDNAVTQIMVADALEKIKDPKSIPSLLKVLEAESNGREYESVRQTAASSLKACGWKPLEPSKDKKPYSDKDIPKLRQSVFYHIASRQPEMAAVYGDQIIPFLYEISRTWETYFEKTIMETWASLGPKGIRILIGWAAVSPSVSKDILDVLEGVPEDSLRIIIDTLSDSRKSHRIAAATLLRDIKIPKKNPSWYGLARKLLASYIHYPEITGQFYHLLPMLRDQGISGVPFITPPMLAQATQCHAKAMAKHGLLPVTAGVMQVTYLGWYYTGQDPQWKPPKGFKELHFEIPKQYESSEQSLLVKGFRPARMRFKDQTRISDQYEEIFFMSEELQKTRMFHIQGRRMHPIGITLDGGRAIYRDVETGVVCSICINHPSDDSLKPQDEEKALKEVTNQIEKARQKNLHYFVQHDSETDPNDLLRSPHYISELELEFSEKGIQWLKSLLSKALPFKGYSYSNPTAYLRWLYYERATEFWSNSGRLETLLAALKGRGYLDHPDPKASHWHALESTVSIAVERHAKAQQPFQPTILWNGRSVTVPWSLVTSPLPKFLETRLGWKTTGPLTINGRKVSAGEWQDYQILPGDDLREPGFQEPKKKGIPFVLSASARRALDLGLNLGLIAIGASLLGFGGEALQGLWAFAPISSGPKPTGDSGGEEKAIRKKFIDYLTELMDLVSDDAPRRLMDNPESFANRILEVTSLASECLESLHASNLSGTKKDAYRKIFKVHGLSIMDPVLKPLTMMAMNVERTESAMAALRTELSEPDLNIEQWQRDFEYALKVQEKIVAGFENAMVRAKKARALTAPESVTMERNLSEIRQRLASFHAEGDVEHDPQETARTFTDVSDELRRLSFTLIDKVAQHQFQRIHQGLDKQLKRWRKQDGGSDPGPGGFSSLFGNPIILILGSLLQAGWIVTLVLSLTGATSAFPLETSWAMAPPLPPDAEPAGEKDSEEDRWVTYHERDLACLKWINHGLAEEIGHLLDGHIPVFPLKIKGIRNADFDFRLADQDPDTLEIALDKPLKVKELAAFIVDKTTPVDLADFGEFRNDAIDSTAYLLFMKPDEAMIKRYSNTRENVQFAWDKSNANVRQRITKHKPIKGFGSFMLKTVRKEAGEKRIDSTFLNWLPVMDRLIQAMGGSDNAEVLAYNSKLGKERDPPLVNALLWIKEPGCPLEPGVYGLKIYYEQKGIRDVDFHWIKEEKALKQASQFRELRETKWKVNDSIVVLAGPGLTENFVPMDHGGIKYILCKVNATAAPNYSPPISPDPPTPKDIQSWMQGQPDTLKVLEQHGFGPPEEKGPIWPKTITLLAFWLGLGVLGVMGMGGFETAFPGGVLGAEVMPSFDEELAHRTSTDDTAEDDLRRTDEWLARTFRELDRVSHENQAWDIVRKNLTVEGTDGQLRSQLDIWSPNLERGSKLLTTHPSTTEKAVYTKLGGSLKNYWDDRGWDPVELNMHLADLALREDMSTLNFLVNQGKVFHMIKGGAEEYRLALWNIGVNLAGHLDTIGLHGDSDEPQKKNFSDTKVLIKALRDLIPLLVDWQPTQPLRNPPWELMSYEYLDGRHQGQVEPHYRRLMLVGLKRMLDPLIFALSENRSSWLKQSARSFLVECLETIFNDLKIADPQTGEPTAQPLPEEKWKALLEEMLSIPVDVSCRLIYNPTDHVTTPFEESKNPNNPWSLLQVLSWSEFAHWNLDLEKIKRIKFVELVEILNRNWLLNRHDKLAFRFDHDHPNPAAIQNCSEPDFMEFRRIATAIINDRAETGMLEKTPSSDRYKIFELTSDLGLTIHAQKDGLAMSPNWQMPEERGASVSKSFVVGSAMIALFVALFRFLGMDSPGSLSLTAAAMPGVEHIHGTFAMNIGHVSSNRTQIFADMSREVFGPGENPFKPFNKSFFEIFLLFRQGASHDRLLQAKSLFEKELKNIQNQLSVWTLSKAASICRETRRSINDLMTSVPDVKLVADVMRNLELIGRNGLHDDIGHAFESWENETDKEHYLGILRQHLRSAAELFENEQIYGGLIQQESETSGRILMNSVDVLLDITQRPDSLQTVGESLDHLKYWMAMTDAYLEYPKYGYWLKIAVELSPEANAVRQFPRQLIVLTGLGMMLRFMEQGIPYNSSMAFKGTVEGNHLIFSNSITPALDPNDNGQKMIAALKSLVAPYHGEVLTEPIDNGERLIIKLPLRDGGIKAAVETLNEPLLPSPGDLSRSKLLQGMTDSQTLDAATAAFRFS